MKVQSNFHLIPKGIPDFKFKHAQRFLRNEFIPNENRVRGDKLRTFIIPLLAEPSSLNFYRNV